jgi:hypothetical protein
MVNVRLIADDLTGALDTTAELVGITGPVPVFWHGAIPSELPVNAPLDSGTREQRRFIVDFARNLRHDRSGLHPR